MSEEIHPVFDSFRLHDERGLPLSVSISAAEQHGMHINLAAFACDAFVAGWTDDKIFREIATACADNGLPFDRTVFQRKLNDFFRLSVKPEDEHPECWKKMKQFILDTPKRIAAKSV